VTWKQFVLTSAALTIAAAQSASHAVLTNLESAKWSHDKGDPPGSESVLLREDAKTGGMELLVRFPAGHVIAPHWHESNERILVLQGTLNLTRDDGVTALHAGAYAFLPARELQRLSCGSGERCTFYLAWDGNPRSHRDQ